MSDCTPIGLYIHVPFCLSKCPYCDFYSLPGQDEERMDAYTGAVILSLNQWHTRLSARQANTLYFGGGTPSLLGGKRIARIIDAASSLFGLEKAEITIEANPGDLLDEVFHDFAAAGGNRISLGMQSADTGELALLGRRHHPQDVVVAVESAKKAGIENISLDLMLGIEKQTIPSIENSIRTAHQLGARHLSAYLLKIEEGTPFYKKKANMDLPDEDFSADMYIAACETIESMGYRQYEISNFAVSGFESRHNLKYWNADPYLGIGPSAHSFIGGRRFYYPRSIERFLNNGEPVNEREEIEAFQSGTIADASEEEYILLQLRLMKGIAETEFAEKFGYPLPAVYRERAAQLPKELVIADNNGIRLTRKGFLLSNPLIARIIG